MMRYAGLGLLLAVCAIPAQAQDAATSRVQAQDAATRRSPAVLYRSAVFTVTADGVRQGPFRAQALAPDHLVTNYPRPLREVAFKFAVTHVENEFPPAVDRYLYLGGRRSRVTTPVYRYGDLGPTPLPRPVLGSDRTPDTTFVTFRADLRHVRAALAATGTYTPPRGHRLAAADLQRVYVAGSPAPLHWWYEGLRPGDPQELTDPDGDGRYHATVPFTHGYLRGLDAQGRAFWQASGPPQRPYPAYTSSQPLVDAQVRLALEELDQLRTAAGTWDTGALWQGVWTRDVSYGILLALALVDPETAQACLRRKVDVAGRIVQDTGTGGAWPVSTDRMVWAMAAWEVYAATGDRTWLADAYDALRRSLAADEATLRDPATGLYFGETSFMDWREQTYPAWMEPVDIQRTQALSTNVLHLAARRIAARMGRLLDDPTAARYDTQADALRDAVRTHLWQPEAGTFATYRYGRTFPVAVDRADALGAALALLTDTATPAQASRVMARQPLVTFGPPTVWPYTPGIGPYHNASVWPFVAALWAWAAADARHTGNVEHAVAALLRANAFFLTNKEVIAAETGHHQGLKVNADRQLWSIAGTLALAYRVLLGVRLHEDRLTFSPFVPQGYDGVRTVRGLRYRGATLDVTVRGYGAGIASFAVDGVRQSAAELPATLTGAHTVEIVLDGRLPDAPLRTVPDVYAPETPAARLEGVVWDEVPGARPVPRLVWPDVPGATAYRVWRNGTIVADWQAMEAERAGVRRFALPPADVPADRYTEWQVQARDRAGYTSFLSAPLVQGRAHLFEPPAATEVVHPGTTGAGYATVSTTQHRRLTIPVDIPETGVYRVEVYYANGTSSIYSDRKAAVRSLFVGTERVGAVGMPQRGDQRWDLWGYSSPLVVALPAGAHTLTLALTPTDDNMHRVVNTALVDHVRLYRLE